MAPKVSIIVPVYNVEKYLPQCLDSLVNQTLQEIEIICVNDESPDNSGVILDYYSSNDKRVKVVSKKNGGLSSARNAGMPHVTGDFFMFIDSDDWLDVNCCSEMYNVAIAQNADCVACTYAKEYDKKSVVSHSFPEDFVSKGDDVKALRRRVFGPIGKELSRPQDLDIIVSAWGHLYSTALYKEILFEDNRKLGTFEDGLYLIDVLKDSKCFAYIDKPLYHYRKTNEGSICSVYKKGLYQKWEYLYERIEKRISDENLEPIYSTALSNRVALGVLSLGLNEAASDDSISGKSKILQTILSLPRYEDAMHALEVSKMGIPWKIFFYLCKQKHTTILSLMLSIIQYLRNHQ